MLHFAVAGSPRSTPPPGGSVLGIERASALGITAMELEWVRSVPKNEKRLLEVREAAETHCISLTVHAPYYVNLNAQDPEKLRASKSRVIDALAMAEIAGAHSVCVHPAFYLGMDPHKAYDNVARATEEILREKKRFPNVNLAYETMGKPTQFGTLEEVLRLSREFGIYPCIDPAHMHARTNGKWNSAQEWHAMFDLYAQYLGKHALKRMHMHFSGIQYTASGERKHLPLRKSDAPWKDFLRVVKERGISGTIVCESPTLEDDTLLLKGTYAKLRS